MCIILDAFHFPLPHNLEAPQHAGDAERPQHHRPAAPLPLAPAGATAAAVTPQAAAGAGAVAAPPQAAAGAAAAAAAAPPPAVEQEGHVSEDAGSDEEDGALLRGCSADCS